MKKSVFGTNETEFLGHHVSSSGIRPLPAKVVAIQDFPIPTTQRQLRRFLGVINFYRRFIPNCADILHPLTLLLRGSKKGVSTKLTLTPEASVSFTKVKTVLAEAVLLVHPNPSAGLSLTTDASDVAIGAVLHQSSDDGLQPLAFFSQVLQPRETRYSTFGKELLAIFLALKHFNHFLEGREFTIFTDHQPITKAIHIHTARHSPREARQLDYIAQFTTDIRYVKGSSNIVADALSRVTLNAVSSSDPVPPGIDFDAVADAQKNDIELQELLSTTTSLKLERVKHPLLEKEIVCDVSTGKPRPYIPQPFRRPVFNALHTLSHPGVKPLKNFSLNGTYGQILTKMFARGPVTVYHAKRPRLYDIQCHRSANSPLLPIVLLMCTSTSSDPFPTQTDLHTSLRRLTDSPVGPKPSHSRILQPKP